MEKFFDYFDERYRKTVLSTPSFKDGPVITVSRMTGCDAREIAAKIVDNLNELEMIDGELWANIWQTDRIARIDPVTGKVLGYVELNNLLPRDERAPGTDVLNGIAWDAEGRRLFVTGKYWPRLYEITVSPATRN